MRIELFTSCFVRVSGLILSASVLACSSDLGPALPGPSVTRVVVSPDSVSIHIGHTLQMTASPLDSAGKGVPGKSVTWSSSDTAIATITSAGLVTAKTFGTVILAAGVDSVSGTALIVVLMPVAFVSATPDSITMVRGGQLQLTAILHGPGGVPLSDRVVTWSSTIPANASVSASGIVSGGDGVAGIFDSSEGVGSLGAHVVVTEPVFARLIASNGADGTCGITYVAELWCWGDNSAGQLGNGTYTNPATFNGPVPWPTGIINIPSITDATTTDYVSCAVTTMSHAPAAVCWGSGDHGRLGNGSVDGTDVPGFVNNSAGFWQVSATTSHTCALAADSSAYCWGRLGSETVEPVLALAGTFRWIGTGYDHTCTLGVDSLAYCWGLNSNGVLGNDTASAAEVAGGHKFIVLAAGYLHTCGLASDSTAYCWGQGAWGQLGTGDTIDAHIPTAVAGGLKFTSIAAGTYHTCALTTQGIAYCWGRNYEGQLGTTVSANSCSNRPCNTAPTAVMGGLSFKQIVTGEIHTCGLLAANSSAYCWGDNVHGQLGDGTTIGHTAPTRVVGQP